MKKICRKKLIKRKSAGILAICMALSLTWPHITYAVALNTTDGKKTPSFTDVRITPGEALPPEEYTEKTASAYLAVAISEKIAYEHGERNGPYSYSHSAAYYFAPAQTERVSYEH